MQVFEENVFLVCAVWFMNVNGPHQICTYKCKLDCNRHRVNVPFIVKMIQKRAQMQLALYGRSKDIQVYAARSFRLCPHWHCGFCYVMDSS